MKYKPIQTKYKGYRFRSRLEARWAVFFDALGIDWEYEPEGYVVSGKGYLPDFRIKCWGTRGGILNKPFDLYVEVKGEMSSEDKKKIDDFCGLSNYPEEDAGDSEWAFTPVLIVGKIPDVMCENDCCDSNLFKCYESEGFFNYETIDGDFFGAYPGITEDGHFTLLGDDSSYICGNLTKIKNAYIKARSARFEYGETPGGNYAS